MSYDMTLSSSVSVFRPCLITTYIPSLRPYYDAGITQADDKVVRISKISENLELKCQLPIGYKKQEGYYTATFSAGGLIIAVAEESYDDMVSDLKYQLSSAWDYYADEKDEHLTAGALKVKKWLHDNMREV